MLPRAAALPLAALGAALSFAATFPASALAAWSADGAALCTASGDQLGPQAAPDGQGGAYVVWLDNRGGTPDLYAQHVNSAGNLVAGWPANGLVVCNDPTTQSPAAIASDGQGGAYVTWTDPRLGSQDVYALRLAAGGIAPGWPANGLAVCTATGTQENPVVCADGAGGAIVAWSDVRGATEDIYAQHLLGGGTVDGAWTAQGALLCNAAHEQQFPTIAPDGAGGAIVAWVDHRNGGVLSPQKDIFAMRVLANGTLSPTWTANGVALCELLDFDQDLPNAVSDGAGGAFVAWQDSRNSTFLLPDTDIYATHVLASGAIPAGWGTTGLSAARVGGEQTRPVLVGDGKGGVIVAWQDGRDASTFPTNYDVYAQHFAADGTRVAGWPAIGFDLSVESDAQRNPAIATDGQGGALVAWQDDRAGADVFAQHVRFDGTLSPGWPADGRALTGALNSQVAPSLVSDGAGGAVCAWQDDRAAFDNNDIYAQRFYGSGQVGPVVGVPPGAPVAAVALRFAGAEPARGAARFALALPRAAALHAAVFDARGRRVATLARGETWPAGESILAWDGRVEGGAQAPPGVYHVRVTAPAGEATLRFVDLPR